MPTVKIPGIGPVEKKWVYIGGAFVVGIVGYAYWNKSRADAAEPEIADYTEGPGYAMDSGVDEYVNPGGSQAPVEQDYNPAPSNNIEWGQAAIEFLNDQGFEGGAIAVGLYMTRQTLSSTQVNMIRAVHGAIGPPPQGDYPITGTPSTSTPKPTPGKDLKQPTGLKLTSRSRTAVALSWNRVTGATGYALYRVGVGQSVAHSADNSHSIVGLQPNSSYSVYVRAIGPDGAEGSRSTTLRVKTSK